MTRRQPLVRQRFQRTSDDPRQHPWWNHVPRNLQARTLERRRRQRFLSALVSQRGRLVALLLIYGAITLGLMGSGVGAISLLVLLPLLILPPLAALVWWLTWKEFHH